MAPVNEEPYPVSDDDLPTASAFESPSSPPVPRGLPEWLYDHATADEAFAAAYDATLPEQRACIKATAAYHYAQFRPLPAAASRLVLEDFDGGATTLRTAPCTWAVVLLHESFASPVQCAAALLPPMLANVPEVCMVRVTESPGREWPPAVLAAAELVGVETVADLTPADTARLLDVLAAKGRPGRVLIPGGEYPNGGCAETLERLRAALGDDAVWRPRPAAEGRIWAAAGEPWRWDTLSWAHPDMRFTVWAGRDGVDVAALPPEFEVLQNGDPASFFQSGPAVLYAPETMLGHWTGEPRLVLGPGREGCWIWPSLTPERFLVRARAWTAAGGC